MPKRRKSDDSSGDSSDESGGDNTQKNVNAGATAGGGGGDDDSSSSSSGGDHEWTSSGTKKSKKKKKSKSSKTGLGAKKSKRSPTMDDDEREEGEVEDDDEDDKSEDDFADEFNDGYDENLMGDEADQAHLAQMTEKEREEELFNRSEKREILRARFQIERKLRMQKKASDKSSSSVPTGPSASPTKTNVRRRNLEDKNTRTASLRHLKEQRDKKKLKQQRLRATDVYSSSSSDDDDDDDVHTGPGGSGYSGPVGAARKSSSSSSSDSSSDDSDMEGVSRHRSHKSGRHESDDSNDERDDYVVSLADLNSIRVTRNQVESWCHTPFFAKTVKDAYVKMGIGSKNAKPVYRIVKIVDVLEGPEIYRLNKTRTNKLIKVRYGKAEKTFRLEFISNSDFAANEFTEWKEKLESEKLDLPKRSMINLKQSDLARATNYQFTESEIEFMVKEKAKFNKNPSNFAMKKAQLLKAKEHAEQMNNYIEAERIQQELNTTEERAKELDKQRTFSIAAISTINERNRAKNIKEAEKAILAEAEKERASGQDDPFKRRKCAPTLFTLKNQKNQQNEGNGTHASTDAVDGIAKNNSILGDCKSKLLNSSKDKLNVSPSRVDDGDLFNAHNFEIQIDFVPDATTSHMKTDAPKDPTNGSSSLNVSSSSNRRSLNLEEYKKKKGLI